MPRMDPETIGSGTTETDGPDPPTAPDVRFRIRRFRYVSGQTNRRQQCKQPRLIVDHRSFGCALRSVTVIPSTPAAPVLCSTRCEAATTLLCSIHPYRFVAPGPVLSPPEVVLDAPGGFTRGFRPLLSPEAFGFSAFVPCLSKRRHLSKSICSVLWFVKRDLECPHLTSGGSSEGLPTPLALGNPPGLPGCCAPLSRLWPKHVGPRIPCQYRVLPIGAVLPRVFASCASAAPVRRFACGLVQAPTRDGHPCRPAGSSPDRARRGLSPPRSAPGRAHQKKCRERLESFTAVSPNSVPDSGN